MYLQYGYIAVAVIIYFLVLIIKSKEYDLTDVFGYSCLYICIALVLYFAILLCVKLTDTGSYKTPSIPEEYYESQEVEEIKEEIYSLDTGIENEVKGKFTLGRGYLSSENKVVYYYYVKGEYGLRLKTIEADRVYIQESDEIKPCIKEVYKVVSIKDDAPEDIERETSKYRQATILVVPLNTIQVDFNGNV